MTLKVNPRARAAWVKASHAALLASLVVRRPSEARNLVRFLKTRKSGPVAERLPWLPYGVIELLSTEVRPGSRVFEYGGGGSTLWFADRGALVETIEHDAEWFDVLSAQLGSLTQTARVRLVPANGDYEDYVNSIERFPDSYFDIVMVDGRERIRCIEVAKAKIKHGGLLMVDDIERSRYSAAHDLLADWAYTRIDGIAPFKPVPAHTGVWRAP